MNQEIVNPDTCISQFDSSIIDRISRNAEQIKAGMQKIIDRYHINMKKSYKMIALVKKIIEIISNNYFNGSYIFTDDLNKSLQIIDTAFEAYFKDISYFRKLKELKKTVTNFENSIENFSQIIEIFASTIEDIANQVKNETDESKIEMINLRLGLESKLFNISVNIESHIKNPGLLKCTNFIILFLI